MKNDVFWHVTPCGSCSNRTYNYITYIVFLRSLPRLLVTSNSDDGEDMFRRNVGSYKIHTATGQKMA
jgi:hypothetical protein